MKVCIGVTFLLLILCASTLTNGKRCFQCQDLPHPSDCRRIVECPETDNCYVDEFVTGGGVVLFNSGCQPRERCQGAGRRDIVARGDILACEACCAGELCNLEGCGKAAPSRNTRGPFCFSCDAQTSETNCRNVALCATDQTCVIGYSNIDKFYTTGCIQDTQCQALQSHVHPVPVGRRNTFEFTTCGTCCNDDFCNVNCTKTIVPIDGHWSLWGLWTVCSVTCGQGVRRRYRQCNNPAPQNHGNNCVGTSSDSSVCNAAHTCVLPPVDGHWSVWGHWTGCSVTCGQGVRQRHRLCNNPSPQNHGNDCVGSNSVSSVCNATHACVLPPVDGHWSVWGPWTGCSVTCGQGKRQRHRLCNNPAPQNHGNNCVGSTLMSETCKTADECALPTVNWHWSVWGQWTSCLPTCEGVRHRKRLCNNLAPQNHGHFCQGAHDMYEDCKITAECAQTTSATPVTFHWSRWGHWSSCSGTCGDGIKHRSRSCFSSQAHIHSDHCIGSSTGTTPCQHSVTCATNQVTQASVTPVVVHWSHWNQWSGCSVTCGNGVRHRSRSCISSQTHVHSSHCVGSSTGTLHCHIPITCAASQMTQADNYVWIGLSTNMGSNYWQWAGQTPQPIAYNNFYHQTGGTPAPSGHQCAVTTGYHTAYYWFAKNCYTKHYVLCEL